MSSPAVRIGPESILGRIGLTRGGDQVESAEFNRRFRVEGDDRTITVQLLDANLQRELLEGFAGRSIDLAGELLVLGGEPDHRDDSLTGVVGEFPAVRQDLERLIDGVPAQFWRAIGADRLPPATGPPPSSPPPPPSSPPPPPSSPPPPPPPRRPPPPGGPPDAPAAGGPDDRGA